MFANICMGLIHLCHLTFLGLSAYPPIRQCFYVVCIYFDIQVMLHESYQITKNIEESYDWQTLLTISASANKKGPWYAWT